MESDSIHLAVTSPPYYNIKDYAKDGRQQQNVSARHPDQIGDISSFEAYIDALLAVWKACERVLAPNGKLAINTPMIPMKKADINTHHNRHIYDINAAIQHSILTGTGLYLYDCYIWNRTTSAKDLMFGSYPYPRNIYANNTSEFITIYVKDGPPPPSPNREASKLTQKEWIRFTKQVWNLPAPNQNDPAWGKHPAIMPMEIPRRCIRMFTFRGDVVLDPMCGSGTTLRAAYDLGRKYVGIDVSPAYCGLARARMAQRVLC